MSFYTLSYYHNMVLAVEVQHILAVEVQRLILMICERQHPDMMSLVVEHLEAVAV